LQILKEIRNNIEINSSDAAKTFQGIERILENLNDMKNYLEDLWQKKAIRLQQVLHDTHEIDIHTNRFKEDESMNDLKIIEPNGDFFTSSSIKSSEIVGPLQKDGYTFTEKKHNDEFESYRVTKRVNSFYFEKLKFRKYFDCYF
jgi:hypothetical protein